MVTDQDQCRCFSLTHEISHQTRLLQTEPELKFETSRNIILTPGNLKLSHFIIHPKNNIICAFNESTAELCMFPSPLGDFYTFRPLLLSILEDLLFVGNSLFVLSRNTYIARYMLSIYSLDGEFISFMKWKSMVGEGLFHKINRFIGFSAEGRMAVTENAERLIVESNLSNRILRNTTLRFYSDECTGVRYSVRQLRLLSVTIRLQILSGIIYEYINHRGDISCYTCKLNHFLPEEDLPISNKVLSVRTHLTSPLVYSISCVGHQFLTPVFQMIDTITYSLSVGFINLIDGTKLVGIPFVVRLDEEPLCNAIKCDLVRIVPIGILLLSDGSVRSFWNLEVVGFIEDSEASTAAGPDPLRILKNQSASSHEL